MRRPGPLALWLVPLLAGCPFEEQWPDPIPAPEPQEVALDWGVAQDCGTAADGGYDDFYAGGDALLVHGSSPEDLALATEMRSWYGGYLDSFELREAGDLTDDDRELDLFVLGAPATNSLLQQLNGTLPVWFEDDRFTFGGYRWPDPGHGISLIHRNPFESDRFLTIYAGNTLDGAASTFTVMTGASDYVAVRGGWTMQLEGDLCRDGDVWSFVPDRIHENPRDPWDEYNDGLESTAGAHHEFLYEPGSYAADNIDALAPWQTDEYERALEMMEVDALELPIRTWLYPDNGTKGQVTGNSGNGHANSMNYEVHEVYSAAVQAVGAHEDVHVIAWHRIGDTDFPLMGEGLAVWVNGPWWGEPLEDWVAQYRDDGTLPSLQELIDSFWTISDGITYPVAGHFVGWLEAEYGIEVVKDLYLAPELEGALMATLGMGLAEIELAWLASVP